MIEQPDRVAFVGLGYVGLCTAVTFAARGFRTTGVEVDPEKRSQIGRGHSPIHEPRLAKLLRTALRTNRFEVTGDPTDVAKADTIFITVGTPSRPDGSIDLTYVEEATHQVGAALRNSSTHRVVVVKSTVTPGTTRSIVRPALEVSSGMRVGKGIGLCSNPEFLREGSAIEDAFHPDKLVIGAVDVESGHRLERLYRTFYGKSTPPTIVTTPETAELVKYASNAFLAAKVSCINTIANIAQNVPSVDVEQIAEAIGLDPRIGPLFLKAGPGYGGSCFHKDLQALIAFSRQWGYDPNLLVAVEKANEEQAEKVVELSERLLGSVKDKRIAVLGLSFKKDTDDVREAASLRVIGRLKEKGAEVAAHDPMAIPNARHVLGDGVRLETEATSAINQADCCIIMTEWSQYRELRPTDFVRLMRHPNLVDARRLYRPEDLGGLNVEAIGLGQKDGAQR
jgi:UDPglucose 6-dehydrogenase